MARQHVSLAALAVAALLLATGPGHATSAKTAPDGQLVVDLSSHTVEITTGFAGSDLLLFGATDTASDIVTVIRGPVGPEIVRRKERVGGIWINTDSVAFAQVPAYYAVASTKPITEILSSGERAKYAIGLDKIKMEPQDGASELAAFREAMVRNKLRQGLFRDQIRPVHVLGNRLFRADVRLPANVPIGTYDVSVYMIRDGKVADVRQTKLSVEKVGFEATVYSFAHQYSLAYGILAIIVAAFSGWLASAVFRKA